MCRYDPSGRWWHAWSGLDHRPVRPGISADQPGPHRAPDAGVRRTKGMRRGSPTRRQGRTHLPQLPPHRRGSRPPPRLTQDGVALGQGRQAALPEDPRAATAATQKPRSATWPRGFARKRPPDNSRLFVEDGRPHRVPARPGLTTQLVPPGPSAPLTLHRQKIAALVVDADDHRGPQAGDLAGVVYSPCLDTVQPASSEMSAFRSATASTAASQASGGFGEPALLVASDGQPGPC